MTFDQFIDQLNQIEEPFDLGKEFKIDNIKNLKFNLDEKLKDENLCFKFSSYNILIIREKNNLIKFDKQVIKEQINNCRFSTFILAAYLNNFNHVAALIIDNKKKEAILFDNTNNKFIKKTANFFLSSINLNYKIQKSKFLNDKIVKKIDMCSICVPLSLLFIYVHLMFETKLDDFLNFLYNNTIKNNTYLVHKFALFLQN